MALWTENSPQKGMREVRLRPAAKRDIESIADYTIAQWGAEQARAYIDAIRCKTESLSETALRHARCPEIAPGFRKARSGSHLIYYRVEGDLVDVIRILHQRMDAKSDSLDE